VNTRTLNVLPLLNSAQVKYTTPITSKFLLEARHTLYYEDGDERYQSWITPQSYSITEQTTGMQYAAYPSGSQYQKNVLSTSRVAASCVTGSHALQTGLTLGSRVDRRVIVRDFLPVLQRAAEEIAFALGHGVR
jgi:hypothetical protein